MDNTRIRRALGMPLDERFLGSDNRHTKYYINPRYAETMALITPTSNEFGGQTYDGHGSKELRGYMISGNLYVWNAYHEIHKFGREYLHRELGIGKDAYSGRPLVIRLKKDGTLGVMLGGIKSGYFITASEDMINKFARLKAALIPPAGVSSMIDTVDHETV